MSEEYSKVWEELPEIPEDRKAEILKDIQLPGFDPDALKKAILKEKKLSFYPGYTLVQAAIKSSDNNKPETEFFVWKPGDAVHLDWTSPPIHKLNDESALDLNTDTVKDYICFFCDFVCGEEGPFTIVESLNSPRFEGKSQEYIDQAKFHIEGQDEPVEGKDLSNEGGEKKKEEILVRIKPMEIKEADGKFTTDACVWYGTSLFESKFIVGTDGMVEMLDDTPFLELSSTGITPWHETEKNGEGFEEAGPLWKLIKKGLLESQHMPIRLVNEEDDPYNITWHRKLLEKEKKVFKEKTDDLLGENYVFNIFKRNKYDGYVIKNENEDYYEIVVCAIFQHEVKKLELFVYKENVFTSEQIRHSGDIEIKKESVVISGLPDDWYDKEEAHQSDPNIVISDFSYLVSPPISNNAQVERIKTPFYKGDYDLFKITVEDKTAYVVFSPSNNQLEILDWTSPPIHSLNARNILKLNKDTAKDYLRFFCDFVTGEEGPFTIIEDPENPRFQGEYLAYIDKAKFIEAKDLADEEKEKILAKIKPMEIEETDGKFTTCVCTWYGNTLFESEFSVGTDGMVEMEKDTQLLELPSTGTTPWHEKEKRLLLTKRNFETTEIFEEFLKEKGTEKLSSDDTTFVLTFDLKGLRIDKKLIFNNCRFRGPVNFRGITCNSFVEFNKCLFENTLDFESAQFKGGLSIKNSAVMVGRKRTPDPATNSVYAIGGSQMRASSLMVANVFTQSSVDLKSISLDGDLTIENLNSNGVLDLEKSSTKGGVNLLATDFTFPFFVRGYLSLDYLISRYIWVIGIHVDGAMTLNYSSIEQYVNFSSYAKGDKYRPVKVGYWSDQESLGLSLYGMQIENNYLAFQGADVSGNLDLNFVKVGSGVFFRSKADFPLRNHIGGSLEMGGLEAPKGVWVEGVSIGRELNATGLKTGDLKLVPAITLEGKESRIQAVDASKSEIKIRPVSVGGKKVDGKPVVGKMNFSFSTITGRAWFIGVDVKSDGNVGTDNKFLKSLDMRNSNIEKNLRFADFEDELQGQLEKSKEEFKEKFKKENETSTKLENPLVEEAIFLYQLKDKIRCNESNLYFKGVMTEQEKENLLKLSEDSKYQEAVEALFQRYQDDFKNKLPFGIDLSMTTIGGDLAISNVDCSRGVINLSDARIERNASITNNCKERNQGPVEAYCLKARSIICGGDFDLTGLDAETAKNKYEEELQKKMLSKDNGTLDNNNPPREESCENKEDMQPDRINAGGNPWSVDAKNATVTGVMRIYPNPNDKRIKGCSFAKIPGELDLEASQIGRLVISNDSFPLNKNVKTNINKKSIETLFDVLSKRTLNHNNFKEAFKALFAPENGTIILKQSCIGTLRVYFEEQEPDNKKKENLLRPLLFLKRHLKIFWSWFSNELTRNEKKFPRPVNLQFADIKYWHFQNALDDKNDESEKAENYIKFLGNSDKIYIHTYRAVENTLINQGNEKDADKIHRRLRSRLLKKERNLFSKLVGHGWRLSTGYGTVAWRLLVFILLWLVYSSYLFSIPTNISPSVAALGAANTTLTSKNNPSDLGDMTVAERDDLLKLSTDVKYQAAIKKLFELSHKGGVTSTSLDKLPTEALNHIPKDLEDGIQYKNKKLYIKNTSWGWVDGLLVAVRYHIPIANLDTHDEWEASSKGWLEAYALFVSVVHWILIPLLVFIVSRRILRRRGSD